MAMWDSFASKDEETKEMVYFRDKVAFYKKMNELYSRLDGIAVGTSFLI